MSDDRIAAALEQMARDVRDIRDLVAYVVANQRDEAFYRAAIRITKGEIQPDWVDQAFLTQSSEALNCALLEMGGRVRGLTIKKHARDEA